MDLPIVAYVLTSLRASRNDCTRKAAELDTLDRVRGGGKLIQPQSVSWRSARRICTLSLPISCLTRQAASITFEKM
jgi:hypothetical protein